MTAFFCPGCYAPIVADTASACPRCRFARRKPGWPPDDYVGRVLAERYRVETRLGAGGFGVVFRARDTRSGVDLGVVALKVLRRDRAGHAANVGRFINEAQAARKLRSPHVVKVYDLHEDDERTPFLVMELLEGESVATTLIGRRRLSVSRTLRIALQVAGALAECHEHGIIHRDLKPGNLVLLADQQEDFVKVIDFGISRVAGGHHETSGEMVAGTPRYMAPEQLRGGKVDGRADIFALGVILFECLSGRRPVEPTTPGDHRYANAEMRPERLRTYCPELPASLDRLLDQMMAKDARERPKSMDEVRARLRQIGLTCGWLETLPEPGAGSGGATRTDAETATSPPEPDRESGSGSDHRRSSSGGDEGAERRQVTVLACRIVDALALTQRLDPEDVHDLVRDVFHLFVDVVDELEGHIAERTNDGVLVYFGYPRAREDDAHRAMTAGLLILSRMLTLNEAIADTHGLSVSVRLRADTGLVILAPMSGESGPLRAFSGPPQVADRLASTGPADAVLISGETRRLVRDGFDVRPVGEQAIEGLTQPVPLFEVVPPQSRTSADPLATLAGAEPLVGRDHELALLGERWTRAMEGDGQLVLVRGEAGIGKSRLVGALRERVRGDEHTLATCYCLANHEGSAFHPFARMIERMLGIDGDDTPATKRQKLEAGVAAIGIDDAQQVDLLADLIGLRATPDGGPLVDLPPKRRRRLTFDALLTFIVERAQGRPLLVIAENIQWIDPSSSELLGLLIEQGRTMPMLLVATCRPKFRAPWIDAASMDAIALRRLSRDAARRVVQRNAAGVHLDEAVVDDLVDRADGVPLYLEELAKAHVEGGTSDDRSATGGGAHQDVATGPRVTGDIPAFLHPSLMAKLDRLPTAKPLAQMCSVVGREFSLALVRAAFGLDDDELDSQVRELLDAEVVYRRGIGRKATLLFKHALIRDTAYQTLLRRVRQRYHQQVAEALERDFVAYVEDHPEQLAHHQDEAGIHDQAIASWQRAAGRALSFGAYGEASGHLDRAIALLGRLADSSERRGIELGLRLMRGKVSIALKGYAAPEVEEAFDRARELAAEQGDDPSLHAIKWGLWAFYLVRARLDTALGLAEELSAQAAPGDDAPLAVVANQMLGVTHFFGGQDERAAHALDEAVSAYDPQAHYAYAQKFGQDHGLISLSYLALCDCARGRLDAAAEHNARALSIARERGDAVDLAHTLNFAVEANIRMGDAAQGLALAEEAVAFCDEHELELFGARAQFLRGWARAAGPAGDGLDDMRKGADAWEASGAAIHRPQMLSLVAEALASAGKRDDAEALVTEAAAAADDSGEHCYDADIARTRAALDASARARS